jgi:hypothetical protein
MLGRAGRQMHAEVARRLASEASINIVGDYLRVGVGGVRQC